MAKTTAQPPEKVAPTIGTMLLYRVTHDDAAFANVRRVSAAHRHSGGTVTGGDVAPLIVVKEIGYGFNGQVFLDGNDTLWVHTTIGDELGQCYWPGKA